MYRTTYNVIRSGFLKYEMPCCDNLILVILWLAHQEDNKLQLDISCHFGGQYVFVPVTAVFIIVHQVNTLQRVVTHSCPTSKNRQHAVYSNEKGNLLMKTYLVTIVLDKLLSRIHILQWKCSKIENMKN